MTAAEYKEYLQSEHWQEVKKLYRQQRVWKCACGERKRLDLHHLTYERLGHERLDDLRPLCRPCHHALHLGVKGKRATLRDVQYMGEGRALLNREISEGYALLERERRRERQSAIAKANQPPPPPELPVDTLTERQLAEQVAERLGIELPAQPRGRGGEPNQARSRS